MGLNFGMNFGIFEYEKVKKLYITKNKDNMTFSVNVNFVSVTYSNTHLDIGKLNLVRII